MSGGAQSYIALASETVQIDKKVYEQLLQDQKFLYALQGAGVDNWSGYDFALEQLEEDNE